MRLEISACLDEQADDVRVMFGGRPHQCALILRRLLRVDVGTARDQEADRLNAAAAGTRHERRLTCRDGSIRIGASLEQEIDERRAAIRACAR